MEKTSVWDHVERTQRFVQGLRWELRISYFFLQFLDLTFSFGEAFRQKRKLVNRWRRKAVEQEEKRQQNMKHFTLEYLEGWQKRRERNIDTNHRHIFFQYLRRKRRGSASSSLFSLLFCLKYIPTEIKQGVQANKWKRRQKSTCHAT